MDDVVPLAVEAGVDDEDGAGAVLLLARPTVLEASYSPLVAYEQNGGVGRRWTKVALRDGVATVPIRGPMPPTFRVRLDGYDGGPLGVTPLGLPTPDPSDPLAQSLLDALAPFVAACTGLPESAVRSTVALAAPVAGDVLVAATPGERVGRGRVVVTLTDPAEQRAAALRARGRRRSWPGRPARPRDHQGRGCGRRGGTLRDPPAGLQQQREPVPRRRSRRRPGPAGRQRDQHVPGIQGHAPARWDRGAGGRGRAASRPLPAGHLGPARRRRAGGRRWCAAATRATCGPACGDGAGAAVSGPGSRPRRRPLRQPPGRGTPPGRSA